MRRAVAVALLIFLAACGDDGADLEADGAVTAGPRSSTTELAGVGGTSATADALEVELVGDDEVPAGPHTWSIEVTNGSGTPVAVTFSTSQRVDAVIARDGDEIHRWSDDRVFQQEVTEISLDPGTSEVFDLADDLTGVAPGTYDLALSVSVVDPPEPTTRTIRVVTPGG